MSSSGGLPILPLTAYPSADLAAGINTFTILTATGGDILIQSIVVFVSAAGVTVTSASIQTDNTTVDQILSTAEGLLANLTAGKNLKVFSTPTILPSGKRIRYTVAGSPGTGMLKLAITYIPLSAGAVLA